MAHGDGAAGTAECGASGARTARAAQATPRELADTPTLRVAPPGCGHCGGHARPGVVWFNESLPGDAWRSALRAIDDCDLLLVVGTSGLVHPAAGLPGLAKQRGARVVEINPVESALSDQVDLSWRATAAQGLALIHGAAIDVPD